MSNSYILNDNSPAELNRVMKLIQADINRVAGKESSTPSNIASGTQGLSAQSSAALAAATGALTGLNQINSVNYLTNGDQINLLNQWNSELAVQAQLDIQAIAFLNTGSTAQVNFDNAISAFSTNMIAAGAPANWQTAWPSGSTLTLNSGYTTSSIATWWATIASTQTILQNAINAVINTLATTANLVPNPTGTWGPVPNAGWTITNYPNAWTFYGYADVQNIGSGNAYYGGAYCRVAAMAGGSQKGGTYFNPLGPSNFYIGQPVLTANEAVSAYGFCKLAPGSTGTTYAQIEIDFYSLQVNPPSQTSMGSSVGSVLTLSTSGWTEVVLYNIAVPAGANTCQAHINLTGSLNNVWYDNLLLCIDPTIASPTKTGVVLADTANTASTAVLRDAAGAINVSSVTANGGVTATYFAPTADVVSYGLGFGSTVGVYLRATTGSSFDFVLINPAGNAFVLTLPTGSNIPNFPYGLTGTTGAFTGAISSSGVITASGAAGASYFATSNGTSFGPLNSSYCHMYSNLSFYFNQDIQTTGQFIGAGTGLTGTASGLSVGGYAAAASTVTMGITGGNRSLYRFESTEGNFLTYSENQIAHGGPRKPDVVWAVIRCKTAELNYAVNDEVSVQSLCGNTGMTAVSVFANASDICVATGDGTYAQNYLVNHNGGARSALALTGSGSTGYLTNWKLVTYALWL